MDWKIGKNLHFSKELRGVEKGSQRSSRGAGAQEEFHPLVSAVSPGDFSRWNPFTPIPSTQHRPPRKKWYFQWQTVKFCLVFSGASDTGSK